MGPAAGSPHLRPWFALREPQDARALPALLTMRAEGVKISARRYYCAGHSRPARRQKSGRLACGTGTKLESKGSILFSAQIDSYQALGSRRQRLAMHLG